MEKEEGITFKPYISKNIYLYGIYDNFYERGQKLLNDSEEENKKYKEEFRKSIDKKIIQKKKENKLLII